MKRLLAIMLSAVLAASCCFAASAEETEPAAEQTVEATAAPTQAPDETQVPDETQAPEDPDAPLYGDADRDGRVTVTDATVMQKYIAEIITPDELDLDAADVDFDGAVTVSDVTVVQRYLAEFITHFSVPKKLTLTPQALLLGVGERVSLTTSYTEEDGAVKFSSDDPEIATVDENGEVTAVGAGEAVITATADKKQRATCTVTVKKAVTSVTLNAQERTLCVGERFTLVKTIAEDEDSYSGMFLSDSPEIVSVDSASGEMTANAVGQAEVSYETYNGVRATCTVTVKNEVKSFSLDRAQLLLSPGETFTLSPVIAEDETAGSLTFTSSDSETVSVSADGTVTAVQEGKATVTATAANGVSASCEVGVMAGAPTSVKMSASMLMLGVGDVFPLRAYYNGNLPAVGATFSSGTPAVASVDAETGAVTAVSVGYATVTVKSPNGKLAKCYVSVRKAPTAVAFNSPSVNMLVGERFPFYLRPVNSDEAVYGVTYESSDESVCTVSASGVVGAVQTGSATITALTYNGLTATVTVNVLADAGDHVQTTQATVGLLKDSCWKAGAIVSIPKDSAVTVYDTSADGRWFKVQYGENCGWIYNKTLGVKKNYTSITLATLPAVADDFIYDHNADIRNIYDYVFDKVAYRSAPEKSIEEMALHVLSTQRGVCYQRAGIMCYIYERMGKDSIYVSGTVPRFSNTGHKWNLVKTGSGWRHVDATPVIGVKYYNVTDAKMSGLCSWNRSKYPAAE